MNQLYDVGHYQALEETVIKNFEQRLKEIEEFATGAKSENKFLQFLSVHISDINFEDKLTHSIYWITQIEEYLEMSEILVEYMDDLGNCELETELFDCVHRTDFTADFKDLLDKGTDKAKAYKEVLSMVEQQLVQFNHRHFRAEEEKFKPEQYRDIYELGEFENRMITRVEFGGVSFGFLSNDENKMYRHKDRLISTLKKICKFSPQSAIPLKFFTSIVIPIMEEGVVSYSSQNIPRFSMINIDSRDEVDLMDDILHENGHHHLNFYLNHQELLVEDDDQIYYSPWRRALRPVRGIYHAVFTFYWALKLFYDLSQYGMKLPLTDEQKNKVHLRFGEEYIMLMYCKRQLDHAWITNKLTQEGKDLIDLIYREVSKTDHYFLQMEAYFKEDPEISDLQNHLREMYERYPLDFSQGSQ